MNSTDFLLALETELVGIRDCLRYVAESGYLNSTRAENCETAATAVSKFETRVNRILRLVVDNSELSGLPRHPRDFEADFEGLVTDFRREAEFLRQEIE